MYSWGDGSRGHLGLRLQGAGTVVAVPQELADFPEQVTQVAAGESHTLILSNSGKVWTCGRNSSGQLGRRRGTNNVPVALDRPESAVGVACGQEHCLALCKSGEVLAWGRGSEGQLGTGRFDKQLKPRIIRLTVSPSMPTPVIQVACGKYHSLVLTKEGEMFSWGRNGYGQLGLGRAISTQAVPSRVLSLIGVPVIQVCAGGEYSFAISLSGEIYCCGANNVGQLGLNRVDENGRFTVCAVPALRALSVCDVSCGEAHSVVLTKDGDVFTFGEGTHGQLGHNSTNNELRPRKVEGLEGGAKQIACGSHHTLVLMASGHLLAFGNGPAGQLGTGRTENQLQPTPVEQTWRSTGASADTDMKIAAGWNASFIYSAPPEEPVKHICEKLQRWFPLTPESTDPGHVERDPALIFSSSSALVGSFLRERESPSRGPSSVDLHAARRVFTQLQGSRWMEAAVNLVSDLCLHSMHMRSVEIFLILPECQLFQNDHNIIAFIQPLARSIINLPESSIKRLRILWSDLELESFKKHLGMWRHALSFLLKTNLLYAYNTIVKDLLQILKEMYKVNKNRKASQTVPASEFHLLDLNPPVLIEDLQLWCLLKNQEETPETPAIFCRFPFVLDLQRKTFLFQYTAAAIKHFLRNQMWPNLTPPLYLPLRRFALVEDTFQKLGTIDHENFKKDLAVKFVEKEDSELTLLDRKDFFLHIFKELCLPESGMFRTNDSETLLWFPVKPTQPMKRYFLFGVLCGLAVHNNNTVYLPFPQALFKKLLNAKPTLEDLRELSLEIASTLKNILEDRDDVGAMDLPYSASWDGVTVELDPTDKEKSITNANKYNFVRDYVDYIFNKSVETIFGEVKRGFFTVCDVDLVELFQPRELMELMVGNEEYDWEKFRQNSVYEGAYELNHPYIKMFWEVFEELSEDEKKTFFLFLRGSERVPILGMAQVQMRVQCRPEWTEDHSPEALTCHDLLFLPIYPTKEMLKTKLIHAIRHDKDYWKDELAART
ncbi:probable E3 ubiquitin-protein ligase HERC6 [Brienomyrus brachyistius]|uniref:probable E3 ubiquitin-protein ligase HERC6 n=1 Tax=Brienomyrus brachyistius TaxID=42636 RepID=UPI0020B3DD51|nr:probable E3 ubiquitin-protein ligase HERC6 [Brienomyrus brachyistius]